jgi:hypothetical protein
MASALKTFHFRSGVAGVVYRCRDTKWNRCHRCRHLDPFRGPDDTTDTFILRVVGCDTIPMVCNRSLTSSLGVA